MVALASFNAGSRAALASRQRTVTFRAQQTLVPAGVRQFAAAAAVSTSLLAAAPAFANGVSFSAPSNNTTVSSPVHLEMTVDGMQIRPAADGLIPGTGHFHVFVDVAEQPEEGESIPFDEAHKHYGKGQTAVDIDLAPVRGPTTNWMESDGRPLQSACLVGIHIML
eukprot:GHUV01033130.1.p1 GENE.GHUV01033130.1~~GHUV01033130.1.p1  ORF type:complete len:166 (+),score=38.19 GHUV01033130.1:156-653(+)